MGAVSAAVLVPAVYEHSKAQQGGERGGVAVPADRRYRPRQPPRQPHNLASTAVLGRGM